MIFTSLKVPYFPCAGKRRKDPENSWQRKGKRQSWNQVRGKLGTEQGEVFTAEKKKNYLRLKLTVEEGH